mmetsp:Transcript_25278/g.58769  ORF Transcript_25278/g.58769 Transcript_25278/m.58769 type:complete len:245 (-) Transcript_25278:1505-2239(-)
MRRRHRSGNRTFGRGRSRLRYRLFRHGRRRSRHACYSSIRRVVVDHEHPVTGVIVARRLIHKPRGRHVRIPALLLLLNKSSAQHVGTPRGAMVVAVDACVILVGNTAVVVGRHGQTVFDLVLVFQRQARALDVGEVFVVGLHQEQVDEVVDVAILVSAACGAICDALDCHLDPKVPVIVGEYQVRYAAVCGVSDHVGLGRVADSDAVLHVGTHARLLREEDRRVCDTPRLGGEAVVHAVLVTVL